MAMVRSPTIAPSKLDSSDSEPWSHFVLPKIWWKGPEEHIRESRHAHRVRSSQLPLWRNDAPGKCPPPNHVRILFWWTLEDLKTSRPKAEVSVDVPLESDGSLDLVLVQRILGLESVSVIHPLKWKIFEPTDPKVLSPLAVHNLSLKDHIFITEGIPAFNTSLKRVIRLFCIDAFCLSVFGLYSLVIRGGYGPKPYVPVPEWYDNVADYRNSIVSQAREFMRELGLVCRILWVSGSRFFRLGTPTQIELDAEVALINEWVTAYGERRRAAKQLTWVVLIFLLFLLYFIDQFLVHIF